MSALTLEELQAVSGGSLVLRGYQADGVNWLRRCYGERHGAILADEMGLGKTCQTIAFLLSLLRRDRVARPFLVLAPLSVTHNWQEEIRRMCGRPVDDAEAEDQEEDQEEDEEAKRGNDDDDDDDVAVIVYTGDMEARGKLQERISSETFHLVLTTYELCLRDSAFLRRLPWSVLVVDEGHRLKSRSSLLHRALLDFDVEQRVLLTGTPVQNNLAELHALLSFVAPDAFPPEGLREFARRFAGVGADEALAAELGELLGPYVLRRLKVEVAAELPAKTELVLYHGVSALQKRYYRAILSRDLDAIEGPAAAGAAAPGSRLRLMNALMQLRKCVDHPYLFDGAEPEPFEEGEHLVSASGKLLLLDRILSLLRPAGHRALVFSQMTRMLDILQDYLEFRGYSYERLDGSVRGEERHLAIKSFGRDDVFVFLLSTRAGGVGLNLTAADTVVFVDSDFNPQNDAQAAARAHRIGQTRPVKVIRLVGRGTVEEAICRRAEAKLRLTRAVTAQMREDGAGDDAEARDESPKQLSEILLAGLGTLVESDEGSSVEVDLRAVLGESRDGRWVIEEPAAEGPAAGPSRAAAARDAEEDRRVMESADYLRAPVVAADLAALSLLRREADAKAGGKAGSKAGGSARRDAAPAAPRAPLSQRERAERKRRREELARERDRTLAAKALRRDAGRRVEKLAYWVEAMYDSLNVELPAEGDDDDDDDDGSSDGEGEEGGQIRYVLGDVTVPDAPAGRDAIVVHCVDNSGRWGRGGLFSALDRRSTQPKYRYERAGEMSDLTLGDAHLVHLDDRESRAGGTDRLALVVAQSRDRRNALSGISLAALETGLRRVRAAARRLRASVHLPRVGHATPGFNWYATERLVRKHLASRGIPAYIYYHPRRAAQGAAAPATPAAAGGPGPGTSATLAKPGRATAPSASPSSSPARPSARPPPSDLGGPSASGSRPGRSEPWSLGFPDFMSGVRAHFCGVPAAEEARLARYLVTYDGDASKSVGADTTHVVVAGGGTGEPGQPGGPGLHEERLREAVARFPGLTVVTAAWLQACFCAGKKLACAPYVVKI